MEYLQNDYRALEVSALAKEGMAHEAERQAQGLLREAAQHRETARQLREEMARVALMMTEEQDD